MIIGFREERPSRYTSPVEGLPHRRAKAETACPYCRRYIRVGRLIVETEIGWLHDGCAVTYCARGWESVTGRHPRRGTAHSDYSTPCPGCGRGIIKGDKIVKLVPPFARPGWWHRSCDMQRPERRRNRTTSS